MRVKIEDLPIFKGVGLNTVQPDKTAFTFVNTDGSDEKITYLQLFENTNRVAHTLLKAGIGKGDTFSILMRNHPEFLYAMFAALSIGAIAVPIDPRSKERKLSFQINNTKSKGIILTGEFIESLDEIAADVKGVPVIGVAYKKHHGVAERTAYPSLDEVLAHGDQNPPDRTLPFDGNAPAQIIHTSGTTGDPKGVVLKANRYTTYAFLGALVWKYQPDDIPYTGLSMTHGNSQSVTIIPSLAKGIPAVIGEKFTKSRIWDICRKYGCTTFSSLGGMLAGIYNEPPRPDDGDNPVRVVISAGTPRSIWVEFEKRFNVKIHEWYAAIEGGFAHNPPGTGPVGSFGKPIEGIIEVKIVDENDNECPPGVKGELISRMKSGDTEVTYYGKKKESEEKTRGGWLRSGDICHQDENGFLYFDFRKGGGLRRQGDFIQPDLIEKIIGEHESVSEVCVYGIPAASGAPGESDIVAAVAPFEGKKVDVDGIKKLCLSKLERNSIPGYIQIVDEIPKTVTEKALERVLRDIFRPDAANVAAITV
ncbi:MAG: AMP-binding protein [Spirochaetes bacterium]|nr:AMP-binding protein [Spirochaetota bacterium]